MGYNVSKAPSISENSAYTRRYGSFRGVDFSSDNAQVALSRSPFSVNMWRNYKSSLGQAVETRVGHRIYKRVVANTVTNNVTSSAGTKVNALHFFSYNGQDFKLVHVGTKLYQLTESTVNGETHITATDLNATLADAISQGFAYGAMYVINDGTSLTIVKVTESNDAYTLSLGSSEDYYIPTTYIIAYDDTAIEYQQFNILTGKQKNEVSGLSGNASVTTFTLRPYFFNDDGTPKTITVNSVTKNGEALTSGYSLGNSTDGRSKVITLTTALVAGDVLVVEFSQVLEDSNVINRCKVNHVFDNRAFYTGDSKYPNRYYFSMLDKPLYVGYMNYEDAGVENVEVKALVPISSSLALIKGASGQDSSVYIISEVLNTSDEIMPKSYPNQPIICGFGCEGAAYNFLNDAVFLTKYGVKAIGSLDLHNERGIEHRSSLADGKLTNEDNLDKACFAEFRGYLCLLVNGRIYLADSRATFTNNNKEYEWFLWDNIGVYEKTGGTADANVVLTGATDTFYEATCIKEFGGMLYFGTENGCVCVFNTDMIKSHDNELNVDSFGVGEIQSIAYQDERVAYNAYASDGETVETISKIPILSCWTTPSDDFGYRNRYKTTNKRGALADLKSFTHSICKVRIKTTRDGWKDLVRHNGGYFDFSDVDFADLTFNTSPTNVLRFKPKFKKWERISIMFYSDEIRKPFGIYSAQLEAFVGGYAKEI